MTLVSGTRTRQRLISVTSIGENLGSQICKILPSLHALTGCDSVSAFVGKGKKKALDLAKDDEIVRRDVLALGDSIPLSEVNMLRLEQIVCKLYNEYHCDNVDEARYRLFCKGKNVQSQQLPPTSAALKQHLKRANYQAFIWRNALNPETESSPHNHGWQIKDGHLQIVWTDLLPAPEAVMELVCCNCKSTCQTKRCSCVKSGLPCTDACACTDQCMNRVKEHLDDDDDDDAEEDDENEEFDL